MFKIEKRQEGARVKVTLTQTGIQVQRTANFFSKIWTMTVSKGGLIDEEAARTKTKKNRRNFSKTSQNQFHDAAREPAKRALGSQQQNRLIFDRADAANLQLFVYTLQSIVHGEP